MNEANHIVELVYHPLCPMGMGLEILLYEKDVPFQLTLNNSEIGYPTLRIGDKEITSRRAIINAIISMSHTQLQPDTDEMLAEHELWVTLASRLLATQHHLIMAKNEDAFNQAWQAQQDILNTISHGTHDGNFMMGDRFNRIDAAFAPFFIRQIGIDAAAGRKSFEGHPKLRKLSRNIRTKKNVRRALRPNFPGLLMDMIDHANGYLANL